jgi:hypothetical protein
MPTKRQRRKRRRRHATGEGRPAGSAQAGSVSATGALAPGRADPTGRPQAPWGDFPLSEIAVLVGVVLVVAGFFVAPPQGFVMIAVGLALGSFAGLELSIREHFAGYRSHTLLLSASVGVPVLGALLLATELNPAVCVAAGLAASAGAAWLLASAFRRRSGGALFRFR